MCVWLRISAAGVGVLVGMMGLRVAARWGFACGLCEKRIGDVEDGRNGSWREGREMID